MHRPLVPFVPLLALMLGACSQPGSDGDSAVDSGTDTADTDSGGNDTEPVRDCPAPEPARRPAARMSGSAAISGAVQTFDGANLGGMEVQVCDELCIPGTTLADGSFLFEALEAGSYKVDALGEGVEGACYGRVRTHVDLEEGASVQIEAPLYLPPVIGPAVVSSGTYTLGALDWTVSLDVLDTPFGFEDDQFWAAVVPGPEIPRLWELPAPPVVAVNFLPFGTEVSGAFTVAVTADIPDGAYEVWSIEAKGKAEGPLGSATAAGGRVEATVQPTLLTWLFFVPVAPPVE